MAKYIMAGCNSNYARNTFIGDNASEHARKSVEAAVKYFLKRVSEERNQSGTPPLDPLEFMLKPEEYVLYILDNKGIILCSMRLDYYLEQGGSIGDKNG